MVGISVMGQIAHVAVAQWRIGALDKWREDVDEFIADSRRFQGEGNSVHADHERRLDRLERNQDERQRPR